ncbi:uncharacterized protein RAG0_08642 [Rhynchosporium agropyri]|uniref:Uncharacterized protein n=1 Tax=Rhynchosporium agropyri TaxID=914238 RepID=A0A1E1KRS5_9HELO|nr:uncharacterized protein RAG0_08642 [Rhynchosporium agropyri]
MGLPLWTTSSKSLHDQTSSFYEIGMLGGGRSAVVYPAVVETIGCISRNQECKTKGDAALRDLLDIVRTKLLVVKLKAGSGSRATAMELYDELKALVEKEDKDMCYWFSREGAGL